MYYPYFRGKQYDLLALRTLIEKGLLSSRIQPIIEPVKQNAALYKFLSTADQLQQPFYLIENPQAGAFLTEEGMLSLKDLPYKKARILDQPLETLETQPSMLIVHSGSSALMSDWQQYSGKVLVPYEMRLLQKIQGELILSEDVFTRLPKTLFYQENPDEFFSGTHRNFQQRGFAGFSDFSIDSRIYYEHGFPTPILSLHLVYFEDQDLRIRHFLSPEELPSQKEKFLALMEEIKECLPKLCSGSPTLGLEILLEQAEKQKFPGMGVMRKSAVMHHMEIMSRYLDHHC
ncbi:sce7725 family protein [Enterococcus olivae]